MHGIEGAHGIGSYLAVDGSVLASIERPWQHATCCSHQDDRGVAREGIGGAPPQARQGC